MCSRKPTALLWAVCGRARCDLDGDFAWNPSKSMLERSFCVETGHFEARIESRSCFRRLTGGSLPDTPAHDSLKASILALADAPRQPEAQARCRPLKAMCKQNRP